MSFQTCGDLLHTLLLLKLSLRASVSLVVSVSVSFHLGVVPESMLTYFTLDSQIITMLALMLFQVPYVGCAVLTLIALMYCSCVVFCMAD